MDFREKIRAFKEKDHKGANLVAKFRNLLEELDDDQFEEWAATEEYAACFNGTDFDVSLSKAQAEGDVQDWGDKIVNALLAFVDEM